MKITYFALLGKKEMFKNGMISHTFYKTNTVSKDSQEKYVSKGIIFIIIQGINKGSMINNRLIHSNGHSRMKKYSSCFIMNLEINGLSSQGKCMEGNLSIYQN